MSIANGTDTMTERDEEIEERLSMRIMVDAYTTEEQAYGWYAYLDDLMDFPFEARCTGEQDESPLKEGETVTVVGMSSTEPTLSQQFVTVEWMNRELGVPLRQLEPIDVDDDTEQAVGDWHYWLER
jgi:hypothetical protein